jgi:amino acid permease
VDATFWEYLVHILSTIMLVGVAYVAAVAVPGAATVWSICGSSMVMLISFIIPAACYLKIRWRKPVNP